MRQFIFKQLFKLKAGRPVTPGKVLEAHMIRSGYEGEKVASVLPCGYADWLNSGDPGNVIVS